MRPPSNGGLKTKKLRAAEFGLNLAPYNAMFFIGINDVCLDVCNMTMFMIFTVCVIG